MNRRSVLGSILVAPFLAGKLFGKETQEEVDLLDGNPHEVRMVIGPPPAREEAVFSQVATVTIRYDQSRRPYIFTEVKNPALTFNLFMKRWRESIFNPETGCWGFAVDYKRPVILHSPGSPTVALDRCWPVGYVIHGGKTVVRLRYDTETSDMDVAIPPPSDRGLHRVRDK